VTLTVPATTEEARIEGRRRGPTEGKSGEAVAAIAVGAVAFLVGAAIWVFA
jgi:hypothetical protein